MNITVLIKEPGDDDDVVSGMTGGLGQVNDMAFYYYQVWN